MKIILQKIYIFSIYAVIFTIPFDHFANNLAIGILSGSWLLVFHFNRRSMQILLKNIPGLLILSLLFIYIISLTYSDHTTIGLYKLEKISAFLIFPVALTGIYSLDQNLKNKFLKSFVITCFLASIFCLAVALYRTISSGTVEYLSDVNVIENNFLYHRLVTPLGLHATYMGLFIVFSIIIILSKIIENNFYSRKKRGYLIVLIIFFTGFIVLLKSMVVALSLGVSIIVLLSFHFHKHKGLSRLYKSVLAVLGVIILVFAVFTVIKKAGNQNPFQYELSADPIPENWNSINIRLAKWDVSLKVIRDHWLLGTGLGDEQFMIQEYYQKYNFVFGYSHAFNTHNQFLQTFIIAGILGLILLILIFFFSFNYAIKMKNIPYVLLVVLFILASLVESTLETNKGVIFFIFFINFFQYFQIAQSYQQYDIRGK